MSSDIAGLAEAFPEFKRYGAKFGKALDAVAAGGVKECRFTPSGRKITTVVGRYGDEFIDPTRPYCSCSNFFFRVLRGNEDLCYHLLAHKMATKLGKLDVIELGDEDFGHYLTMTVSDVFETLSRSTG